MRKMKAWNEIMRIVGGRQRVNESWTGRDHEREGGKGRGSFNGRKPSFDYVEASSTSGTPSSSYSPPYSLRS